MKKHPNANEKKLGKKQELEFTMEEAMQSWIRKLR